MLLGTIQFLPKNIHEVSQNYVGSFTFNTIFPETLMISILRFFF